MQPTRRTWAVTGLAVGLAITAVVLARPVALVGTAALGAWLCSRAWLAARSFERLHASLSVHQLPTRRVLRTGAETTVVLAARSAPTRLAVRVTAGLPIGARTDGPLAVELGGPATGATSITDDAHTAGGADSGDDAGDTDEAASEVGDASDGHATSDSPDTADRETADAHAPVTVPVAGRHRFRPAHVACTDGLFAATYTTGDRPTLTVEPRLPRAMYVGAGGEQVPFAVGEHGRGRIGGGLEPGEVREAVPTDTPDRIDWKATARLGETHVREYEGETERPTTIVLDHRARLGDGSPGETMFEYLRGAALAIANGAGRAGDPLGVVGVGDGGVTTWIDPVVAGDRYRAVRRRLFELEPIDATAPRNRAGRSPRPPTGSAAAVAGDTTATFGVSGTGAPASTRLDGRGRMVHLEGSDPFERALRPFYAATATHEHVRGEPLPAAVARAVGGERPSGWVVILTDDRAPEEVLAAVSHVRAVGGSALVVIAPTVLYELEALADVEAAYERYREVDRFLERLDATRDVSALAVGPGDRFETVLARARRGARVNIDRGETT